MLCIGSHHPSVTWYLLPTGTARDASPTTPWPQSRYWHSRTSSAAGSNPISSRKSHGEQSSVMGTRQAILTSHADSPSYINVCNKKFTMLGDSQHCFFAASLVRSRAKLVEGMFHKLFFYMGSGRTQPLWKSVVFCPKSVLMTFGDYLCWTGNKCERFSTVSSVFQLPNLSPCRRTMKMMLEKTQQTAA